MKIFNSYHNYNYPVSKNSDIVVTSSGKSMTVLSAPTD
jgi:hypothetical protein